MLRWLGVEERKQRNVWKHLLSRARRKANYSTCRSRVLYTFIARRIVVNTFHASYENLINFFSIVAKKRGRKLLLSLSFGVSWMLMPLDR